MSNAEDRLRMLQLALPNTSALCIDDRELRRDGPSYTIDTLEAMHQDLDSEAAICLVMGMDAFQSLPTWYRWQELLTWCHVIVMTRPGWDNWRDKLTDSRLQALLSKTLLEDPEQLRQCAQGKIFIQQVTPLDISASKIRKLIMAGQSAGTLCPRVVLQYIEQQGLYGLQDRL